MEFKVKMFFKLFILISLCIFLITCDACDDKMKDYLSHYNPMDKNNPWASTGTGFNDLGKYDMCIKNTNNKFVVVRLMAKFTVPLETELPIFLGVCLDTSCANEGKYEEMKILVNSYTGIDIQKIEIIDSEKENSKYKIWTVSSVFILIILLTYLLFATGLVKIFYELFFINKTNTDEDSAEFISNKKENEKVLIEYKETQDEERRVSIGSTNSKKSNSNGETTFKNSSPYSHININSPQKNLISSNNRNLDNLMISIDNPTEKQNFKKSKVYTILDSCFDLRKNFNKIFEFREGEDKELKVFDGIRVLTCCIIIMDHIVSLLSELPLRNPEVTYDYFKDFLWQFFFNSIYTVDLFFSLSGFFLAYISLKNLSQFKKATIPQIILSIMMRLLRIWPVYALMFLAYWKFYIFLLDGPISGSVFNKELQSCDYQWPFMLTLLTNFTYGIWETAYPYCMSWYWYIPNDFQYCIIGVFLLVIYGKSKKLFFILYTIINLLFMGVESWLIVDLDLGVNLYELNKEDKFYKYYYLRFYTRSSPFFIGLLLGIWYSSYKRDVQNKVDSKTKSFMESVKNSTLLSVFLYAVGVFIMATLTFCTYWSYDTKWSFTLRFIYTLMGKRLYVIGLFIFCLPLMMGNLYVLGGWLGSNFFLPLAKLSFSTYIIHPFLIKYVIFNVRYPIFFNGKYLFLLGFAFIVASYCVSIIICTLFEMPFQNIRELFKRKARKMIREQENEKKFKV